MALIFTDGADSYAATSDLTKKWASAASPWAWGSTLGRNGGGGIQAVGGSAGAALKCRGATVNATLVCFGFWLKVSSAPAANTNFLQCLNSLSTTANSIQILTTGALRLVNNAGSTVVSGSTSVCDGNWHWVEIYFNNAASSATQKLYVDGIVEWSGVATGSGFTCDNFQFLSISSRTATIDDIVVYDDESATVPATTALPLGPREIITLRPSGDSSVQFAPDSGGTNYTRINETNADGDTSYVQDSVSSDTDLYNYDDLSTAPANITGVMLNGYIENPNAGTINFKQVCKSSATQTDGTSVIAPAAYRVVQQQFGVDPATSSAWGFTGLNAALFGIKVV